MTPSVPRPPGIVRAAVILAFAGLATGCGPSRPPPAWPDLGGDPGRGAVLVNRYSCGACHVMPGVEGANGLVGPPLGDFGRRTMVAGVLPNTPPNLVSWLRHPQAVVPGNAMPDVGLSDAEARDIAAWLYRQRR